MIRLPASLAPLVTTPLQKASAAAAPDKPVVQMSKKRMMHPGTVERILLQTPGKAPDLKGTTDLYNTMAAGSNGALDGLQTQLGYADSLNNYKRVFSNPRSGPLGKAVGAVLGLPSILGDNPEMDEQGGPWYHPLSNVVMEPWKSPGATMHEYGHAIDFNRGPVPKTWLGRQAKGTLRDAYMLAPFTTLWKEHAAWRKGRKALIEGSLQKNLPAKDLEPTLMDAAHVRAPALGTYWGGAIGGLAGTAAGVGAVMSGVPPIIAALLAGGIGTAGVLGGLGIGHLLRKPAKEKEKNFLLREYPHLLMKRHPSSPVAKTNNKTPSAAPSVAA